MMSHLAFTLFSAILVSGAAGLADPGSARERWYRAARMFAGCVLSVVAGGWFMHLVHG